MASQKFLKVVERQPQFAYDRLEDIDFLQPVIDIPYCHHIKWDGSGYPCGVKGEEIPLSARVFAVVDSFDVMASDRPYCKGMPLDEVLKLIKKDSGTYFDPDVVNIFIKYFKNIVGK